MIYILMYLVAIVLANLSATHFGASATIVNAFLFIGLDLTARDKLHEKWNRNSLVPKMMFLIAVGSAISYLLNRNAAPVAIASLVAFLCAGTVDAIVYHILRKHNYLVKVNGSNVFGAIVDSIVFPTIAFGGFLPLITLGQFAAKVAGGALWAYLLGNRQKSLG